MNWLADKVEHWPTTKLIPYARNARQHYIPVTLLATGQTFAEVESERLENTDASLAR